MAKDTSASTKDPTAPSRRTALRILRGALGGAAVLELGWLLSDFFAPRKGDGRDNSQPSILTVGPVKSFEKGSVTPFPEGKFYLARLESGGFLALCRTCTHLGCTVPWDKKAGRFICPCHTSSFDIRGEVLSAPAPRPLDLYTVRIENGIVKVDISAPIPRERFSSSQVEMP